MSKKKISRTGAPLLYTDSSFKSSLVEMGKKGFSEIAKVLCKSPDMVLIDNTLLSC